MYILCRTFDGNLCYQRNAVREHVKQSDYAVFDRSAVVGRSGNCLAIQCDYICSPDEKELTCLNHVYEAQ